MPGEHQQNHIGFYLATTEYKKSNRIKCPICFGLSLERWQIMASLNKLVVNLTANTGKFDKSMKRSQSSVRSMAGSVAKLAAAYVGIRTAKAAGAWMIGLASDAETLEVKFRVLLKSGDKAKAMIAGISEFAAKTPFQKMDIGNAAQQLLAFNVPAGDVMDTLGNLGDIAALTGNDIGELAELFGKANVQGTLMSDDLNQLTGRGIPVLQEFAKQLGVPISEVKKLASEGKITSKHLGIAFRDMTASGGQFADGMAQLSETTAGKWSTLKDNFAAVGQKMGTALLPLVQKIVDGLMPLMPLFESVATAAGDGFTKVQDVITDAFTVIAIVAQNIGKIWKGMFQDIPVFAGAAFDWVSENMATMAENLLNLAKAFPGMLDSIGKNLGEEFAFAVGMSDEKIQFDPLADFRAKKLTKFDMPDFGPALSGVMQDVDDALAFNRKDRALSRATAGVPTDTPAGDALKPGEAPKPGEAANEKAAGRTFAGAMAQGTQDAYSAIINATGNKQTEKMGQIVKNGDEANGTLKDILKAIETGGTSVVASFGVGF